MLAVNDPFIWVIWFLLLFVGLALLLSDRKDPLVWLSPLRWFSISFFIFFVIAPFGILWFGSFFITFNSQDFVLMSIACIVSGGSFWVGWRKFRKLSKVTKFSTVNENSLSHAQRILQVFILLLPVSIALFLLVFSFKGIINLFVSPEKAYEAIGEKYCNIFSLLFSAFIPLIAVCFALSLNSRNFHCKKWFLIGIPIFFLYLAIAFKIGSRYRLLFLLLSLLAMYLSTQTKRLKKNYWKVPVILLASGFLLFFLGRIRYQLVLIPSKIREQVINYCLSESTHSHHIFFMTGDLDAFENGMELFHLIPYYKPLMYGSTIFSIAYNPIPRVLWSNKPKHAINQYLIEEGLGPAGEGSINFAVSLPAELYANFWWIGIIIGLFFLGVISARLWNWFLANHYRTEAWFHIGLFCAYIFIVIRGSFHCVTIYYLMVVVNEVVTRKTAKFISVAIAHPNLRQK